MKINKNTTQSKIKTNKQQQDKQTNNKTNKQTNKQKKTLANIYIYFEYSVTSTSAAALIPRLLG
jgi:hypothetical protein